MLLKLVRGKKDFFVDIAASSDKKSVSCLTPMCQVKLSVKEHFLKPVNVFCGLLYKNIKVLFFSETSN